MSNESEDDVNRREALAKLAKLSAYSAPVITTLLSPSLSYAQSSFALNNPANQNNPQVIRCINSRRRNLREPLGIDPGGRRNNTIADCGRSDTT